jgi:hypothetical protein
MGIKIIKPGIRDECTRLFFCGDDVASAFLPAGRQAP